MSRYQGIANFRHDLVPKAGVLLVNLGSPEEPTPASVRQYLKEFLSDPRVVEIPQPLWWLILNLVVLNVRPKKSAALYKTIWMDEGSPLLVHSRHQEKRLRALLASRYPGRIEVELGMRYGNPSIADALESLRNAGVQRLLVLPLYPQYSGSTTGSVFDAVSDVLRQWRWVPELRFISSYHDDPDYIEAMAAHIERHWEQHGRAAHLVLSFHGVPKRFLLSGDPYHCQCQKTARLLVERLGLSDGEWRLAFQSRFGREEWLKPYLDKTLKAMPKEGYKHIEVFSPGFSADCLETLEEIAETNREGFIDAGGESFTYIPALNATEPHIDMMAKLVEWHMQGWKEVAEDFDLTSAKAEAKVSLQRAQAQGAEL